MCCTRSAHDCALATWAYMLETVRDAVWRLQKSWIAPVMLIIIIIIINSSLFFFFFLITQRWLLQMTGHKTPTINLLLPLYTQARTYWQDFCRTMWPFRHRTGSHILTMSNCTGWKGFWKKMQVNGSVRQRDSGNNKQWKAARPRKEWVGKLTKSQASNIPRQKWTYLCVPVCDDDDDDDDDNHTKSHNTRFLQSRCATNCLQHVHSSGLGSIVFKSHETQKALITCNMYFATWYKGTAHLLHLTEF